ncbi:MAG: hypothetical protein V4471_03865 [Pseudomonadota bacterium]
MNQSYHAWEKIYSTEKSIGDLNLLGCFYNAYQTVYLLCASKSTNKLYIGAYSIPDEKLSKFRELTNLEEEIYSASVFKETASYTYWYLLGKKTIWSLEVRKSTLLFCSLLPFQPKLYPLGIKDPNRDHEGASLIVFDQTPLVIGGKNSIAIGGAPINTGRRLLYPATWIPNLNNREGGYWAGGVRDKFLTWDRVAPIVHFYDKKLFCIAGNQKSKVNIVESLNIEPYWFRNLDGEARSIPGTYEFSTERATINYEGLNCDIKTEYPRPASCVSENHIFIFSDALFSNRESIYYKYHLASGHSSGSGNGDWEFLIPGDVKAKDLVFTSAKAVTVGRTIYLILFKASDGGFIEDEQSATTQINVFKIVPQYLKNISILSELCEKLGL